jgi:hypothetical protein
MKKIENRVEAARLIKSLATIMKTRKNKGILLGCLLFS